MQICTKRMAGWVRILFQVAGNNPNQEEEPIFLQQVGNANNPNRLVLYISHLDGRVTILFQVAGNIYTTNRQVLFLSHMAGRLTTNWLETTRVKGDLNQV